MKISQSRFSVPFCVFTDPMPAKQRCLLVYLFSISSIEGGCEPGYTAMKNALRDHIGDKGSNTTVRKHLEGINADGWVFAMHRTNGKMRIWLKIPPRHKKADKQMQLISVVQ